MGIPGLHRMIGFILVFFRSDLRREPFRPLPHQNFMIQAEHHFIGDGHGMFEPADGPDRPGPAGAPVHDRRIQLKLPQEIGPGGLPDGVDIQIRLRDPDPRDDRRQAAAPGLQHFHRPGYAGSSLMTRDQQHRLFPSYAKLPPKRGMRLPAGRPGTSILSEFPAGKKMRRRRRPPCLLLLHSISYEISALHLPSHPPSPIPSSLPVIREGRRGTARACSGRGRRDGMYNNSHSSFYYHGGSFLFNSLPRQ